MKKFITIVLVILLVGCAKTETITDREGNAVLIPTKIERIISTAPSNSEILLGLGLGEFIVGVDNYTTEHSELDSNVMRFNFREPDAELLISLQPDIIIASGHNKSGEEDPFRLLKEAGIAVVYIPSSASLVDIYKDIEFIASITSTEDEAVIMIDEIKEVVSEITEIASTITTKKNVYLEISPAPYIYTTGANTFQDELINLIGAVNIFGDEESWISASEEVIIAKNPDVIITTVPGETMVNDILIRDGWDVITAVSNDLVFQLETNPISRPSQNVVIALKQLAEAVYPELYAFE